MKRQSNNNNNKKIISQTAGSFFSRCKELSIISDKGGGEKRGARKFTLSKTGKNITNPIVMRHEKYDRILFILLWS